MCLRQASRFEALYRFYLDVGLREMSFFIVNSNAPISVHFRTVLEDQVDLIPVYQDNANDSVWESLGGGKDDVYVYDRCGLLTAYVPFPLSLLTQPFVEAAILNTYFNDPCKMCPLYSTGWNLTDATFLENPELRPYDNHTDPGTHHRREKHGHQHEDHGHHSNHSGHDMTHSGHHEHYMNHSGHEDHHMTHSGHHEHHMNHSGHEDHHMTHSGHHEHHMNHSGHHEHHMTHSGHHEHDMTHSGPHEHEGSHTHSDHDHDQLASDDQVVEITMDEDAVSGVPEAGDDRVIDLWEPLEEFLFEDEVSTTPLTTDSEETRFPPRRRRHRTNPMQRSEQSLMEKTDYDTDMCPKLSRPLCEEWRRKFRLAKHCCHALKRVDGDVNQLGRTCSSMTESKCGKLSWLTRCCRRRPRVDRVTDPPTTETLATTTSADSHRVADPCTELNQFCPDVLAKLGFISSSCCPELADHVKKMAEEGFEFQTEVCERFDEWLCYRVRSSKLEHRCCPMVRSRRE